MNFISKYLLSTLLFIAFPLMSHADALLKDNQGQSTLFSALKGKWVFINYWAQWCEACLAEIPELNRFYQNHKKDPIALFGVNFDELPPREQNILAKKFKMLYPSLLENPANLLHLDDITGVPVTFVFNPKGELVKTLYGGQTEQSLNSLLK